MKAAHLIGGVLHDSGTFYLLADHEDAENDESVVAAGRADGAQVVLNQLTELDEIVSIITLPSGWRALGEAACLTAEGTVYFLTPSAAWAEIIPGTGYAREDSLDLGRMTALREVDGWLFAMGFGGQVYRRRVETLWESTNVPRPTGPAQGPPSFNTVAPGPRPGSFVFGGVNIGEYGETSEIEAATEAGDADRLADLILDAVGDDTLTIRIFDGSWSESELDIGGIAGPIIREEASSWLIFASRGIIWRTSDFLAFDEIYSMEQPRAWDDVKIWNARPLVLDGPALKILEGDTFIDFPDPLPATRGRCLSIWNSAAGLVAMYRRLIQLYRGGRWTRLVPVWR